MLNEQTARSLRKDQGRVVIEVRDDAVRAERRDATVLVDANGEIVGVDLRGDDPLGTVVMFGAHERVASTRTASVEVGLTRANEIARVTVPV